MLEGFGISYTQENRRVNDIIREHFRLATQEYWPLFRWVGRCYGGVTALYRNRWPDVVIMFLVILGISVLSFVVAISQWSLVGANLAAGTTILPIGGWGTVWHMLVPASSLACLPWPI